MLHCYFVTRYFDMNAKVKFEGEMFTICSITLKFALMETVKKLFRIFLTITLIVHRN